MRSKPYDGRTATTGSSPIEDYEGPISSNSEGTTTKLSAAQIITERAEENWHDCRRLVEPAQEQQR